MKKMPLQKQESLHFVTWYINRLYQWLVVYFVCFCGPAAHIRARPHGVEVSSSHTCGRTPLNERSARRRGSYPHSTTNTTNEHIWTQRDSKRRSQKSSWPQTYALNRTTTGTGLVFIA